MQLDVSDANAIENFKPPFDRLDVLVLAQGAVIYRRGEFEIGGFRKVLEINLISLMACATKFHALLSAARGSLIIVSSTAAIMRPRAIRPTMLRKPAPSD
jgi:3-oxoacyl-[acyl-carrier protein] reductase